MGQPPKDQTKLYDTYWTTIERCTGNDVSGFVRDYLSEAADHPNYQQCVSCF